MHTYQTPLDLVRKRSPERPVAFARPDAVAAAAHWFQDKFKGDIFYAVKANPSPWVIETLVKAGVTSFDVASMAEIELVRSVAPQARLAFMHPVKSRAAIAAAYHKHGVKTFALDTEAGTLSGGNQQKVVLAKWLATNPSVLIIDEPTRGIDVGTKAEVHRLLSRLAGEGLAILMISSELPEVLGMADRVLVVREGRITADQPRATATAETVMLAATQSLEAAK